MSQFQTEVIKEYEEHGYTVLKLIRLNKSGYKKTYKKLLFKINYVYLRYRVVPILRNFIKTFGLVEKHDLENLKVFYIYGKRNMEKH